jgi:asparagine synthase (glutamine-hydrolysing)
LDRWVRLYSLPIFRSLHKLLNRIKDHAASAVSDAAFEQRFERWPDNTPDTKEGYFIRDIFDGEPNYVHSVNVNLFKYIRLGLFPGESAAKTAVRFVCFYAIYF